jgi:hypothetical protein
MLWDKASNAINQYLGTQDYFNGVLVEITGIAIETVFLSILIPIIIHLTNRGKTRNFHSTLDFYLMQMYHNVLDTFIKMQSIDDIMPLLVTELAEGRINEIASHNMYGNLENKLYLVSKLINEKTSFIRNLASHNQLNANGFRLDFERILSEIDRLITISTFCPSKQEELFKLRILFYVLRDAMKNIEKELASDHKSIFEHRINELYKLTESIVIAITFDFKERRKLIDSRIKHEELIRYTKMALSLLYILPMRAMKNLIPKRKS